MIINNKINYVEFPAREMDATKNFFRTVFDWQFTDCWDEDSDELANGLIQFSNYVEDILSNTVNRIGFEPGGGMDGGVFFLDWTLSETELNQGVYTIDPANDIVLSGGFSMIFVAP